MNFYLINSVFLNIAPQMTRALLGIKLATIYMTNFKDLCIGIYMLLYDTKHLYSFATIVFRLSKPGAVFVLMKAVFLPSVVLQWKCVWPQRSLAKKGVIFFRVRSLTDCVRPSSDVSSAEETSGHMSPRRRRNTDSPALHAK